MKLVSNIVATVALFLLITGMTNALHAQDERAIKQKELPAAVQSAFTRSYPKAQIRSVSKEVEKGKTYYEIESIDGTMRRDLLYTSEGEVHEVEETIAASSLPQSVKDALQTQFNVYTITKAETNLHGTELHYEIVLKSGKMRYEVSLDPSGKIVSSKNIGTRKGKK